MNAGIDYGRGVTNIDHETGIRYGVISMHSILLLPEALADLNSVYPDNADEDAEAIGLEYTEDGYQISSCLDSDLMITKSDYFTYCAFCSPCVPGAGNLNQPVSEGVKTFCLAKDWFERTEAPYPVYSVKTGELIK